MKIEEKISYRAVARAVGHDYRLRMIWRLKLSLGLEALLWTVALGWLVFLTLHAWQSFKTGEEVLFRDIFEIALLALLVWWPMIRVRIRHGYWMRDWDDAPTAPARQWRQPLHRYLERE